MDKPAPLFVRFINNDHMRYGFPSENIAYNYSNDMYERIMRRLPKGSRILLVSTKKLDESIVSMISPNFIFVNGALYMECVFYGTEKSEDEKRKIIFYYRNLFNKYINTTDAQASS